MSDDNTGVILFATSGMLILAYFAMKDKKPNETPDDESDTDMPDGGKKVETDGPKKNKPKTEGNAELMSFAEDPNGTVQGLLKKASMLANECDAAQQAGNYPLSRALEVRVGRIQDQILDAIIRYDNLIQRACYENRHSAGFYTQRQSYQDLVTFRDVFHAAMTSSDQLHLALLKRSTVVNQIQNDYHDYKVQLNDNRVNEFDQRSFTDKRKYVKTQAVSFNQQLNQEYVVEEQQNFHQLNMPQPVPMDYADPPDNAIPASSAPRLGPSQSNDMAQIRSVAVSLPSNAKPLRTDQPTPIAEGVMYPNPKEDDKAFMLGKGNEFKRPTVETDDVRREKFGQAIGLSRRSEGAESHRPAKKRGVSTEDLFDAAPRPDRNIASGKPQLLIANTAFNSTNQPVERLETQAELGNQYLELLEKNFKRFKKIRVKSSEDISKVGLAGWRVLKTAPTGGQNGQVWVTVGGMDVPFTAKSSEHWTRLMVDGDGPVESTSAKDRIVLRDGEAGKLYRAYGAQVKNFMVDTYGKFLSAKEYASMR